MKKKNEKLSSISEQLSPFSFNLNTPLSSLFFLSFSGNVPIWRREDEKKKEKQLSSINEQPSPSFNLNIRLSSFFPLI